MELQLVSKETAVLAKELGFDWGTNNIIDENDCLSSHVKIFRKRYKNSKEDTYNLAMPEQELLAKWLRDEHNLSIDICFNGSESHYWWIKEMEPFGYEEDSTNQEVYGWLTHEEALENGLTKALSILQDKTNSK